MSQYFFRALIIPASALLLASCATAIEGSQQQITFETEGASAAHCSATTGELTTQFNPPQTIWVNKSRKNLVVDCKAPGNRRKTVEIESVLDPVSVAGGPGMLWDAESGALYKYPNHIVINFNDTPAKLSALPAYHNLDGLDPNKMAQDIENMGPMTPSLKGDAEARARAEQAYQENDAKEAWETEREERKAAYDPGVKK